MVASYALRIRGGGDPTQRQASILVRVRLCDEFADEWGERHRGKANDGMTMLRLALDSPGGSLGGL